MVRAINHWLHSVSLKNPIDQRRAPALLLLLVANVLLVIIAIPVFLLAPHLAHKRALFFDVTAFGVTMLFLAIVFVRTDRLQLAVTLMVATQIMTVTVMFGILGVVRGCAFMFCFSVPIILAALAGGRVQVMLASLASIVITSGAVLVDVWWRGETMIDPVLTIGVYVMGALLLAFFAGSFAHSLQTALSEAFQRQQELEQLQSSLEQMVDKRTADLQQALAEVKLREATLARALNDYSESEARQRAIINAIPDIIFRITRTGEFLYFKADRGLPMFTTANEIIGTNIAEHLPDEQAQIILDNAAQALDKNELMLFEYEMVSSSQPADIEVRMVACGDNEVLGIARNITERKNIERMKNEFVSVVSHELRTPLTSIRGAISLVAAGVAGPVAPKAAEMLNIAQKNSERLLRLINDILNIEKIESGTMPFHISEQPLRPLIEQAVAADQGYGEQYDVAVMLEGPLPDVMVRVDGDRLQQVLANLISNAVKFSPAGETVRLTVTQEARRVRVSVIDRGVGIPETFYGHMFQKFAQADSSDTRQKGGTGLGLSISKAIIETFGGTIDFTSEVDVGSTFFFDLPIL